MDDPLPILCSSALTNQARTRRADLEFDFGVNIFQVLILSADCSLPIVAYARFF
jgi:hypothetical protein